MTGEWSEALVMSTLWGAGMLSWSGWKRHREGVKPIVRIEDVLSWVLMGLWFGTILVFGWRRSFQMPNVVISVGAFAGALLIPLAFRIGLKNSNGRSL